MAHLIRQLERDAVDATKAKALAYIASLLIRSIEGSQIEQRLDQLESAMEDKQ